MRLIKERRGEERACRFLVLFIPLALMAGGAAGLLGRARSFARDAVVAPPTLRETGLYSDYASRTVDRAILSYSPQYPLWSDGASKRRWIYLPPGTSIDASDPDVWVFPEGTKIWKEFSFHGRRVETRLMQALGGGRWMFVSYAWNAEESDAVLAPPSGLRGVAEIQPGLRHDIPAENDCRVCHEGGRVEVLGFSALQLSSDRDAEAPHKERLLPGMIDLSMLIDRGLIRSYPAQWARRPPRIAGRTPTERAALGYMHANCGNCHNPNGDLESLDMLLRHSVAPKASGEPALLTTVDRKGQFQIPGAALGETYIVRPGDPARSAILYRMASRNPLLQMPPLATKTADEEAVRLIERWIRQDLTGQARRDQGKIGGSLHEF